MKKMFHAAAGLLLLSTINSQLTTAFAQGTAFTYQGQLQNNGSPASGTYAMTFALFNTNTSGVAVAGPVTNNAVPVTNGLFTVTIDFVSGAWNGQTNWLQIAVSTNGANSFTNLAPRQQVTPAPYAIYAGSAGNLLGALPATNLTGTVPLAQLPVAVVTNEAASVTFSNVTVSGTLNLPSTGAINAGGSSLIHFDGANNFYAGPGAGTVTNSGSANTAIGSVALQNNTNGTNNTAIGYDSLGDNTNGAYNTATGERALGNNTSGNDNTADGRHALEDNTTGNGNTAEGYGALASDQVGSFNIALGYLAGSAYNSNASNNIDIGNTGTAGENYTIHLGDPNTHTNTFIAGVINGNGGGLTNLNASQIGSGVIPASVLPGFQGTNYNTVDGGQANGIIGGAQWAAIGGGFNNTVSYSFATVGGGADNTASFLSTVGGGSDNTAGSLYATVAGGDDNAANGPGAFVGGGGNDGNNSGGNMATGAASAIAGGLSNLAGGEYAAVGGGTRAHAGGLCSTVPGGYDNQANGNYSFAAGQLAQANDQGTFVWADSQIAFFSSTGSNQFLVRAQGGVGINTASPEQALSVVGGLNLDQSNLNSNTVANALTFGSSSSEGIGSQRTSGASQYDLAFFTDGVEQMTILHDGNVGINTASPQQALSVAGSLNLDQSGLNSGTVANALTFGSNSSEGIGSQRTSGASQYDLVFYTDGNPQMTILHDGDVGIGNTTPGHLLVVGTGGAYCDGTTWVNGSDRNSKHDFAAISPGEVLEKVSALPISEWQYKVTPEGVKHIGPMAQDFHAAFGLNGTDDKHISTVDEGGVALAAIQGLNEKMESGKQKAETQMEKLEAENAELKQQNDSLAERLNALEAAVKQLAANR